LPPRPADGTRLFLLDEAGLLFSEPRQELHALNHSAAFIWCCLEEGMAEAAIGTALAELFGLPAAEADRFVRDSLAQWRDLGLLAGSDRPIANRAPVAIPQGHGIERPDSMFAKRRLYRLLDSTLLIRFAEPAQVARVHPVLAHLAVGDGAPDVTFDLLSGPDGHEVHRDGAALGRTSLDGLAPLVKSQVWVTAINHARYFLYIHAGVLGADDGCLLLPAPSGSGKSVLTLALARAGLIYLSDEAALLAPGSLSVRPVPLSPAVKAGGWDLLASRYPALAGLPIHLREDGKRVRYLPPPALQGRADGWTARWLVFPRYDAAAETALLPLSRVEALHRIMAECMAIPAALDRQNVADLVAWMSGLACFELPMSDLDQAVALVRQLVRPRE